MATFPEDPVPVYPLTITPRFSTVVTTMNSGVEERTARWLYPKYDVRVRYQALSSADAQTLWNFFLARKGSQEAFWIYDFSKIASITKSHVGQYLGLIGTGESTLLDIPGVNTSGQTVYANGVQLTAGVFYNYDGLGGGGSDRVAIVHSTSGVSEGDVITADFSGYLRMRVRFAQDEINQELFTTTLFNQGIELRGLAAA